MVACEHPSLDEGGDRSQCSDDVAHGLVLAASSIERERDARDQPWQVDGSQTPLSADVGAQPLSEGLEGQGNAENLFLKGQRPRATVEGEIRSIPSAHGT